MNIRDPCQIWRRKSHQAIDCFHRMDFTYQGRHPHSQLAAMVAYTNASIDEKRWYADNEANNHITGDL